MWLFKKPVLGISTAIFKFCHFGLFSLFLVFQHLKVIRWPDSNPGILWSKRPVCQLYHYFCSNLILQNTSPSQRFKVHRAVAFAVVVAAAAAVVVVAFGRRTSRQVWPNVGWKVAILFLKVTNKVTKASFYIKRDLFENKIIFSPRIFKNRPIWSH